MLLQTVLALTTGTAFCAQSAYSYMYGYTHSLCVRG